MIIAHGEGGKRHTHLAYSLHLPEQPGEVQKELPLPEEGSYLVRVKNPEARSPPGVGLRGARKARLPKELMERFRGRRFGQLDPPDFLDHEGTEVTLVGASEDTSEELGVERDRGQETEQTAGICGDLRLECSRRRTRPLFEGHWV